MKQNEPHRPRTGDELLDRLREHTALIASYCQLFDQGNMLMALPMSMSLRVMFHKARIGEALLAQTGLIGGPWLDSSAPKSQPFESIDVCCLVGQYVSGAGVANIPHLGARYPWPVSFVSFEEWWRSPIGYSAAHGLLTREDIVLGLANREAGHVDGIVDLRADALREGTFLNCTWGAGGKEGKFPFVAHAAARTIAHGALGSLAKIEPQSIGATYSFRQLNGVGHIILAHGETSLPNGFTATPGGRFDRGAAKDPG